MKYPIHLVIALLAFTACSHSHSTDEHDEHGEHHPEHSEEHAHVHDDGDVIELSDEDANKWGVKCTEVSSGDFTDYISVTGQIITDPSQQGIVSANKAGIITLMPGISIANHIAKGQTVARITSQGISGGDDDVASKAEMVAAKREVDRLKPLLDDGIVTRKEYDAAVTIYEIVRSRVSTAQGTGTVASPISGLITSVTATSGQFVNIGDPIAVISNPNSLILRADLPDRYMGMASSLTQAQFKLPGSDEYKDIKSFGGVRRSGEASTQGGYLPLYFSLPGASKSKLVAGTYVTVILAASARKGVISLPTAAIMESEGEHFVFVKTAPGHFEQRHINTGARSGNITEIVAGLSPGEEVATEGVTFVKLASQKGAVPEGHSHNH